MRCFQTYRLVVAVGLLACVAYSNPIRVPSVRVPSPRVPIPRVPIPHVPNYSPEDTEEKKKACGCDGRKRWEGCLGHDYGRTGVDVPEYDGHHHDRRDDVSPKASADIDKSELTPEEIMKRLKLPPGIPLETFINYWRKILTSYPGFILLIEKGDTKAIYHNKRGKEYPKVRTAEEIREHFKKNRELKEPPHEKRSFPRANSHTEKSKTKPEDNNKKGKEYPKARTVEEIREHFEKNRRLKDLPHEKRQDYTNPHYEELSFEEQQALRAVNVTVEQNGKDPIAINIIIRNNSKMNVTIMTRNSVVDKDSFRLGYFNISPDDTKINFAPQREEFEWFHENVSKYTKPFDRKYRKKYLVNDLVHLRPNETYQQTIPIPSGTKGEKEQWFKMIRHAKKIKLFVEGKWFGIGAWKGEQPHWAKNLDYGFKSNTIEVQLPA
ncbi:hypothetical protein NW752_008399 [Fusarium irregulare]|uniref:Uncharacterized protein n=1 Tax=Fusarium irregulare TaxID=2494466 RepID=A0A9W8UDT8_9HYPO|nr:hypothetical protein NW752_008399 [Fusarium irregulare]KAJ4019365.1 hypothetical protein NW766_003081 [Fusarium irregulare]